MTALIGIGAGGHARVMIEALKLGGQFRILGILDVNKDLWNQHVAGLKVLGDERLLSQLFEQGVTHAFIGVGSVGVPHLRSKLFRNTVATGFKIVDTIHPSAIVSANASWGCGLMVFAGAVINPGAALGENVIVNTGAIVEHDCIIGDHVHVATGARLAGDVKVGSESHVGVGASVREGIRIGSRTIVGAGAVVVKDVPNGVVVTGNPARVAGATEGP